jgi:hypothetical protein
MSSVIGALKEFGTEEERKRVYLILIQAFQGQDWDTEMENYGEDPAFDVALRELEPDWFDNE